MHSYCWIALWCLLPMAGGAAEQDVSLTPAEMCAAPPSTLAAMAHVIDAIGQLQETGVDPTIHAIRARPSSNDLRVVTVTVELRARAKTAQQAEEWFEEVDDELAAKLWRRFDGGPVAYGTICGILDLQESLFSKQPDDRTEAKRAFEIELTASSSRVANAPEADTDSYIRTICRKVAVNFGQVRISHRTARHDGFTYKSYRVRPEDRDREFKLVQVLNLLFSIEHDSSGAVLGAIDLRSAPGQHDAQFTVEFDVLAPAP